MDLLDRAFVHHANLPSAATDLVENEVDLGVEPLVPAHELDSPAAADPRDALWDRLAGEVEQAVWQGRRVIALTAAEHGVGVSTIAVGLARALDRRGHRMAVLHGSPLKPGYHDDLFELAATHDVVLVDPGPWFGPGRLRRERLARLSQGCDAAIIVRRESAAEMPGVEAAVEAVGLACLGEVLTFSQAAAVDAGNAG